MLLERTAARPVGDMPAGGGPVDVEESTFEANVYGRDLGAVVVPVPMSFNVMVAALVGSDTLTREELATPAAVRREVELHLAYYGVFHVYGVAKALVDANPNGDDWVLFCRQAVAGMLAAEGVASGLEQLTADEMTAALTVHGDLYPENLATPDDIRRELTRIAYVHGVDALRALAADLAVRPYKVNAPAFDTEAHAWPGFCRQAVTAMLTATGALAGAR